MSGYGARIEKQDELRNTIKEAEGTSAYYKSLADKVSRYKRKTADYFENAAPTYDDDADAKLQQRKNAKLDEHDRLIKRSQKKSADADDTINSAIAEQYRANTTDGSQYDPFNPYNGGRRRRSRKSRGSSRSRKSRGSRGSRKSRRR